MGYINIDYEMGYQQLNDSRSDNYLFNKDIHKQQEEQTHNPKFYWKVKEFKQGAKSVLITDYMEQHMGLKGYDGVFTVVFVPPKNFE